jgi:aspartyl-tRNA(Asn)/glutamyl-tRNA(Gln) amidotransferase subunit A
MIAQLARSMRAGEVSSAALVGAALARIEELNQRLNLFITVLAEPARRRAAELDSELARGRDRGPLHGIPVAVKDLVHMRAVRTTAGSAVFANFIAGEDAEIVTRLESAGAVILGKTGLHELAYGITSNNPHFGAVRNPCDPERIPGGSSGGSGGAVAAGIVPMAIGTDTGGSIRIPASFCGCVGLKPTYGRVSKRGVLPLGFTLDHIGPLAASVDDAAMTLEVLAGQDPLDPTTSRRPAEPYRPGSARHLKGVRVGRPTNFYFEHLAPEVDASVSRALETARALGAEIVGVRVPPIEEINAVARVILLAEASAALAPHLPKRELFGPDVLALFDQGRLVPATDYVQAQRLRRRYLAEFRAVWESVDCLFTASTPTTAPRIGQTTVQIGDAREDVRLATTRLARAINLLGVPALSIPCGRDSACLPVGLQIIAPPFAERNLLRIGAAVESAFAGV